MLGEQSSGAGASQQIPSRTAQTVRLSETALPFGPRHPCETPDLIPGARQMHIPRAFCLDINLNYQTARLRFEQRPPEGPHVRGKNFLTASIKAN